VKLPHRPRRPGAAALAATAALSLLAACETGPRGAAPGAADGPVVTAGGRDIRITPPDGFCVDGSAIRPEGDAAFVLIEDCALAGPALALADDDAASGVPIPRPAAVAGLVTLSIGDGPLFDGPPAGRGADFDRLAAFLRSERGRASAGMGGDSASIRIVETRRAEDTLYVLVEDAGERVVPVLGDRFWRGFTEVRDRAVIASLGVFDRTALRDETKLAHLARVVAALKTGNGMRVSAPERKLAAAAPPPPKAAPAAVAASLPEAPEATPPARPDAAARAAPAPGGTPLAPEAAPRAPRRPAPVS
jgi:hypothetical protein